jgi:hypothetical protein
MPASQAPASIAGFPNTWKPAMRPLLITAVTSALLALAAPVPEPSQFAMLLAGLGAVGFIARRRRG